MSDHPDSLDPRPAPSDASPAPDSAGHLRPAVAGTRPMGGLGLVISGTLLLGLLTFAFLNSHRATPPKPLTAETGAAGSVMPPPPPPSDLALVEAAGRAPPYAPAAQAAVISPPITPLPVVAPPPVGAITKPTQGGFSLDRAALSRKSPALVVDLAEAQTPAGAAAATGPKGGTVQVAAGPAAGALSGEEQFAQRVGAAEPERSRATLLGNAKATIPQGAMIPGVLETALDSDLPGFARAVVSRDVRGFDGSTVLVPRGSRIIGQYKSAVAQGQTRAFVIWTRIIRPDGATIQIGSPVTDPLGRAGLDGKVDRHFFERFGGSILLSVLNAGVTSLSRAPSTQVVIGSSSQATSLGAEALLPTSISPTIKVPQGAAIRIFVARDLDFSTVPGAQ